MRSSVVHHQSPWPPKSVALPGERSRTAAGGPKRTPFARDLSGTAELKVGDLAAASEVHHEPRPTVADRRVVTVEVDDRIADDGRAIQIDGGESSS